MRRIALWPTTSSAEVSKVTPWACVPNCEHVPALVTLPTCGAPPSNTGGAFVGCCRGGTAEGVARLAGRVLHGDGLMCHDWPKPPIWPEDLPLIHELLSDEECAELLRRMVQVLPHGPLLDYRQAFAEQELKAPLLQDSIEELLHGLQRGLVPRRIVEKPVRGTLGGKDLGGHARCLERVHHVNRLLVGDLRVVSSVQKQERCRLRSDVRSRRCLSPKVGVLLIGGAQELCNHRQSSQGRRLVSQRPKVIGPLNAATA